MMSDEKEDVSICGHASFQHASGRSFFCILDTPPISSTKSDYYGTLLQHMSCGTYVLPLRALKGVGKQWTCSFLLKNWSPHTFRGPDFFRILHLALDVSQVFLVLGPLRASLKSERDQFQLFSFHYTCLFF